MFLRPISCISSVLPVSVPFKKLQNIIFIANMSSNECFVTQKFWVKIMIFKSTSGLRKVLPVWEKYFRFEKSTSSLRRVVSFSHSKILFLLSARFLVRKEVKNKVFGSSFDEIEGYTFEISRFKISGHPCYQRLKAVAMAFKATGAYSISEPPWNGLKNGHHTLLLILTRLEFEIIRSEKNSVLGRIEWL